jgi:hypothetical protein
VQCNSPSRGMREPQGPFTRPPSGAAGRGSDRPGRALGRAKGLARSLPQPRRLRHVELLCKVSAKSSSSPASRPLAFCPSSLRRSAEGSASRRARHAGIDHAIQRERRRRSDRPEDRRSCHAERRCLVFPPPGTRVSGRCATQNLQPWRAEQWVAVASAVWYDGIGRLVPSLPIVITAETSDKEPAWRGCDDGLHAGEARVGTIGSADRMAYTVLGATVNLAALRSRSTRTAARRSS